MDSETVINYTNQLGELHTPYFWFSNALGGNTSLKCFYVILCENVYETCLHVRSKLVRIYLTRLYEFDDWNVF